MAAFVILCHRNKATIYPAGTQGNETGNASQARPHAYAYACAPPSDGFHEQKQNTSHEHKQRNAGEQDEQEPEARQPFTRQVSSDGVQGEKTQTPKNAPFTYG